MKPEKLNLWDRFFNRYRKEFISQRYEHRYRESWYDSFGGEQYPACHYRLNIGIFKKIDRLTGSETIIEEVI